MSYQDKKDACGIFCCIFIYIALIYTNYAFFYYVVFYNEISVLRFLIAFFYEIIVIFITWSHLKACGNPGVWRPMHNLDFSCDKLLDDDKNSDKSNSWTVCTKCETYRPPRTHHCSVCRCCIKGMDHHCPWINNCVGQKNLKFFLQFLFYVGVMCLVTLIFIFLEFLDIKNSNQSHIRALHCITLLVESLLFGIFVIAVFSDQIYVLKNNESSIDRLQNRRSKRPHLVKKNKNVLKEVCGRGSIILWLLPISSEFNKRDNFVV